jgi:hypothetical protein
MKLSATASAKGRKLMVSHPDFLRTPENINEPDPRSAAFAVLGADGFRSLTLQDQYDSVHQINLHDGIPKEVVVNFETAKNLSLFSWYVYRFHTAAKGHAYACLELALRTRFGEDLYAHEEKKRRARHDRNTNESLRKLRPYTPIDKENFRTTLGPLMRHAYEVGAIRNEAFEIWQRTTTIRAKSRRITESIEEMTRLGLDSMTTDDTDLTITEADKDHDYVERMIGSTRFLRNIHAHGTASIDHKSLSTLRLVAEIINQIFPPPEVCNRVAEIQSTRGARFYECATDQIAAEGSSTGACGTLFGDFKGNWRHECERVVASSRASQCALDRRQEPL